MTNVEAIEFLEGLYHFADDVECGALNMAIDALEKQIPKKVVKGNAFREIGFCPNCNEPIRSRTSYKSSVGKVYMSWCSECGQTIDWREEEVNE